MSYAGGLAGEYREMLAEDAAREAEQRVRDQLDAAAMLEDSLRSVVHRLEEAQRRFAVHAPPEAVARLEALLKHAREVSHPLPPPRR